LFWAALLFTVMFEVTYTVQAIHVVEPAGAPETPFAIRVQSAQGVSRCGADW